jgi:hypothetical protein
MAPIGRLEKIAQLDNMLINESGYAKAVVALAKGETADEKSDFGAAAGRQRDAGIGAGQDR